MLRAIGATGVLGVVLVLAGFGVVGYVDPVLAGGLALIVLGAGLLLHAAVRAVARQFGMGNMV